MRAVDMERHLADAKGTIRRTVVEIGGTIWLVIDSVDAPTGSLVERVWNMAPETRIERLSAHDVLLFGDDGRRGGRLTVIGDTVGPAEILHGSRTPFAGWIVRDGQPVPSPAMLVRQPGGASLLVTVLTLGDAQGLRASATPGLLRDAAPEHWQVATAGMTVRRDGATISAQPAIGKDLTLHLRPPPKSAAVERSAIVTAYLETASKYPRFRDLTDYRIRLTKLALALLALQELVFAGLQRLRSYATTGLRWASAGAWVALGLWVWLWYLG
jgi:hypothetical protein